MRTTGHPLSASLDISSCDIGPVSSAKPVGTCNCLALCCYTLSFPLTFSFQLDRPSSLDAFINMNSESPQYLLKDQAAFMVPTERFITLEQ